MSSRPVFVIGAPRSGTTLVGAFLGSASGVADLGEYVGYDFCYRVAVAEMGAMPAVGVREYLAELQAHAHEFPKRLAAQRNANWFVVSAPWNLLVASRLAAREPEAIFVLCIRKVYGVCQSLARSYAMGRFWAGADTTARISLWCQFYAVAPELPLERTVVVDYDQLCADPESVLRALIADLVGCGFPAHTAHLQRLTESYANPHPQPTIARQASDGTLIWQHRRAWDHALWTTTDADALAAHPEYPLVNEALSSYVARCQTTSLG